MTVTTRNDDQTARRTILRAGLAIMGAAAGAGARAQGRTQVAQEKIAPKMVQYQDTPKDGQKCIACVNFELPKACKIVSGVIEPEGWCIAFAPKSS